MRNYTRVKKEYFDRYTLQDTLSNFKTHFKIIICTFFPLDNVIILFSSNDLTLQMTNFRLFQSEKVADDNFKFNLNGRKVSKRAENTVGKG